MSTGCAAETESDTASLRRRLEDYERWFRALDAQVRVLDRERQKLAAIVNHTDAGFLALDVSRRVVWMNEVFHDRFWPGSQPGAILGQPCHKVLCRRAAPCAECPSQKPFDSGEVAHHEIHLEIEGRPSLLYATAIPILSPEGRVEETILMVQDVTDLEALRRSQEALRASEERFRSIFEKAAAGMFTFSPDGRFLQVNPAMCAFLGYTEEELLRLSVLEVTHPDDLEATRLVFRQPDAWKTRPVQIEKRYVRKDGAAVWGRVSAAWLYDAKGNPVYSIALVQDITERKRLEEELLQSQKLEAIGTLAGGVAHDFNNILTGILGHAEMLRRRAGTLDETTARASEVIAQAARRGAELAQQLLGFARKGRQQNVAVDLRAAIQEVVGLLSRTIDKRIQISTRFGLEKAFVLGDPVQIGQVILNLAINARDAMPDGGRLSLSTERVEVIPGAWPPAPDLLPGTYVALAVGDTGSGIPEEVRDRIFEPFFTTKERGHGTGMGLAMAYGIVRDHGGAISYQSAVGIGTTFVVYIPLEAELSAPATAGRTEAPRAGVGRILVVDDEEIVRDVADGLLRHLGYEVVTVPDGPAGVEYYEQHGPEIDLVIIDMVMSKISGRDCFLKLREIDPGVKAILSTGYAFDVAAQEMLEQGMLAFIQKPFDLNQLSEVVARALGR